MTTPAVRTGRPCYMYDAIAAQPEAIAAVIASRQEQCAEVAGTLAGKRRIYGIGTSWHAALVGAQIMAGGPECFAYNSFEFCTPPPSVTPADAAIVISHRGTKRSSYEALDYAVAQGAYTVAITATNPGPRIQVSDAGARWGRRFRRLSPSVTLLPLPCWQCSTWRWRGGSPTATTDWTRCPNRLPRCWPPRRR